MGALTQAGPIRLLGAQRLRGVPWVVLGPQAEATIQGGHASNPERAAHRERRRDRGTGRG